MDHKILTQKLEHYGINGKNLSWFQDYLINRKQYIQYDSNNNNNGITNNNSSNNNKKLRPSVQSKTIFECQGSEKSLFLLFP